MPQAGAAPAHRRTLVWTRVPGGVRGRERLSPFLDFLVVLLVLVALTAFGLWCVVWGVRNDEGIVTTLSVLATSGMVLGLTVYVRGPFAQSVVLRPESIELPAGRETTVRVRVLWEDVADVQVVAGSHRTTLRLELRDGACAVRADSEADPLTTATREAPAPDVVKVVDAESVARVLRHMLAHPGDRVRLADRVGLGLVLAFAREH